LVRQGIVTEIDRRVTVRGSDGRTTSCFFWHSTVGRRNVLVGADVELTCVVTLNTNVAIKIVPVQARSASE
jgi:hypothetical protein